MIESGVLEFPPPWFLHAQTFERAGIIEQPGKDAHPTIVSFFKYTHLPAPYNMSDETPWCSAFICAVMEQCGVKSTKSAAASSWREWGQELKHPIIGCVVVLDHHVTLYAGSVSDKRFAGLGGNQRNRVCTKLYNYSAVISYRWPKESDYV